MRFDNILVEDKVKEKILSLHNVRADEIKGALLKRPIIFKTIVADINFCTINPRHYIRKT